MKYRTIIHIYDMLHDENGTNIETGGTLCEIFDAENEDESYVWLEKRVKTLDDALGEQYEIRATRFPLVEY